MRRPRYKLQVSTFPFLAVLLCAMGSLLMLLFIMDRRARIAAQHANDEVLQARKKRTKDEEESLQADWEKAKEKLHQALLLQEGQLASQAQGLQIDIDSVGKKLHLVQTQYHNLDDQAKAEAAKIAEMQIQIVGRRKGLLEADKKETMSKKELIAAAQELAELEIAFQQLLTVKEREKLVHSLVPYHGKRGDSRAPIYVECVGAGVIFHPNDKELRGFDFSASTVRRELERRAGPLVPARMSEDKLIDEKQGAYVLFLVRPSGISNYYLVQAVLKGYRLDFGYELIDQDWELDFGGTRYLKNGPISMPAKRNEMPIDNRPIIEQLPIYAGQQTAGSAQQAAGSVPGFGMPGFGAPFGGGSFGGGVGGGLAKGPAFVPINKILPPVPVASTDGSGNGLSGYPGGGTGPYPPGGTANNGGGTGPYPPGGTANNGGGAGQNAPGGTANPGGGGTGQYAPGGTANNGGGAGPYSPGGTANPGGGGTGQNAPGGTANPGGGGTGQNAPGGTANNGGGTGQNAPGGTANNGGGTGQNASGSGAGSPNGSGRAPMGGNPNSGGPNPGDGPVGQGDTGGAPGSPNANGQSAPGGATGGGGPSSSGNGDGAVGPPSLGAFGDNPKTPKKAPANLVLSRVLGNKDFLITIECYSDFVRVTPGGMYFRWTAANLKSTDQAFAQAVANLIERRQASVRAGEPPYHPLICFRVTADGRPMCLHAYPLLEPLHVPMTRENVVE